MMTIAIIIVAIIAGHITTKQLRARSENPDAPALPVSPAIAGLGVTLLTSILLSAII